MTKLGTNIEILELANAGAKDGRYIWTDGSRVCNARVDGRGF